MSEENKAPVKEKSARQPKAKPIKTKEAAPRRRERPIDAKDVFAPGVESGEAGMNDIFRMRLAYLMNGNNAQGKAVNIQELADAVGVSRPAIRKYLKPKGGAATTPSAATVCATSARRRTSCSASTRRTRRRAAERWKATTTTPSDSTSGR